MQLKKYTDYGLRVLMYLASKHQPRASEPPRSLTTIREICEAFELSANHVNKVVHHLGRLQLIHTQRGKFGGFELAQIPATIRLDKVIRQLEGDEYWIDCKTPLCRVFPSCELKHIVNAGKETFYRHLSQYTLADLITPDIQAELTITTLT